jgi:hypothetical protein
MRIGMFSWETLRSQSVGGIVAHVTELAAALERRGQEGHVFTRPGYGSGDGSRIDRVWYHYSNVTGLKTYATPESVGWGLGTLFTNFEWARWMGANGRQAAEATFSWGRIAEKAEQCYQS